MRGPLTILGGGGWFPAQGRQTACALLRLDEAAIVIDAGSGVGRLAERPELLEGVQRLDILLTHFHLDHVCGLAYLPAMQLSAQTTIWGPGARLYDVPTADLLNRLSHEPFHPVPLEAQQIDVRDLPKGELELSGVRIASRRQDRHSAPSLGLRFDDAFAWITDTAYDPESARFAEGCGLLAHEAWYTDAEPRNPDIHSSAAQAAEVAVRAGIDRLLLIHLPPFACSVGGLVAEAQRTLPRSHSAEDGSDVSVLPKGVANLGRVEK
jgi:ribonuclease BN (tRNA processing enzyme)